MDRPFWDRPLVYIAAPYTMGDPIENTRNALTTASELMATGRVTTVVPHLTAFWHFLDPKPLDHWYAYDLAILTRCDAVLRLPGPSTGADAEVEFAAGRGIPVFETTDALLEWVAER